MNDKYIFKYFFFRSNSKINENINLLLNKFENELKNI